MRLSHPLLSSPLHWQEGRVPVLVAEKPEIFRQLVFSLSAQAQGEEGDFVLSLDYETLDCADHLHVVRDYVCLVLDDRKLQNRFQSRLQWTVREELASPTDALQQQIGQYLQLVAGAMEYPVSFSEGEYVLPLLKALKCQPVLDGVHPLERLMQYIELYSSLMKEQCFVLVDAHAYFSDEELQQLYRMAGYQKWRLLLLEQRLAAPLPAEDICLLDASLCELRLDSDPEIR